MEKRFEIKNINRDVVIKKDDAHFSVDLGADGDIWFNSTIGNTEVPISLMIRDEEERQTYYLFEKLMKSIIGRYMLNDYGFEYNGLPKDFIDLENKTITWHSDSNHNHTLQLKYGDHEIIVSLSKEKEDSWPSIRVRIRTSGSDYGYYYQEFVEFFRQLSNFALSVTPQEPADQMRLTLTSNKKDDN